MTKQAILGYSVDAEVQADVVEEVSRILSKGTRECHWLACLNPHSYVLARKDAAFAEALHSANWLVPDGIGIVLAGRVLQAPVAERITGTAIFFDVMARLNDRSGSVFFLGGTEQTLDRIKEKVTKDYPRIQFKGTHSPPFKPEYSVDEIRGMIELVNRSGAEVLWVGMTAPKQEKWIYSNQDRLKVCFAGAIGAAFDFYTGRIKRSSPIFRKFGLEWLPRLAQQPRRLWRRVFISGPIFLYDLIGLRLARTRPLGSTKREGPSR